jgi:S-formylglutathione hydrolase FrmB
MRYSLPGLILLLFLALIVNFLLQSHQLLNKNLVVLSQLIRGKNIQKVSSSDFSSLRETQKLNVQKTLMEVTRANSGWNKNLKVDDVLYDLYIPPSYNNNSTHILPCLLVLPGWNFTRTSWVENSKLVEYANKYGYALILPEMGKTLYENSYYPETQLKWNQIPGGKFIKERFIPKIQKKHNLLKPGQHNTLLGLSTGGRGVALIALENPDLFVAGASLSGDFSQENTPKDRLMTAVYGSFNVFPERWQGKDNPQARVSEWKMPLYLAHGTVDNVVPESQSRLFYEALVKFHGKKILVEYRAVKGAEHNYKFWGGQLEDVFKFLDKVDSGL